jgi:hypothetical protein
MSVMACGPIYSQDSTKSTILIQVAELLLLFTVKSKRVWNGIITRISWICFTAFNRKLIHKQKLRKISSTAYVKKNTIPEITPTASNQQGAGLTEHVRDALKSRVWFTPWDAHL